MSTFRIPNEQGLLRQVNRGDIYGEFTETFNIDLSSEPGKIKSSEKLNRILDTTKLVTPAYINDMLVWSNSPGGTDRYYIITEDSGFVCDITDDPTNPANWSVPTELFDYFDAESTATIFDNKLLVSKGTNIHSYNGGVSYEPNWWTTVSGTALTNNYTHNLHVHRGGQETLFVTDKDKVRYYNSAAGHSTVQLQKNLVAVCIDSGINAIWVGTYTETDGNAYVYEMYVGEQLSGTAVARNAYPIQGKAVLALWVKDNVPHIITERGAIQRFNGAGFETIENFPFVYSKRTLDRSEPGTLSPFDGLRPIHPRGVKTYNDSTFILLSSYSDQDQFAVTPRSHSGVWEYNHKTGVLNHRFAFAEESTDYGNSAVRKPGALMILDNQYTFLMAGATCETDIGVFMTQAQNNLSYFVTPEIMSGTVQDAYEAVYHKAKTLAAGEYISTLYRTSKRDTIYGTANWITNDTFTTTDDWSGVAVGDLVRVSHGYATGDYAFVESIESSSTPVYEITVSRSIGTAGQTSHVYSDNFKLISDIYTSDDGEYKKVGVGETSPWIQYMVIMYGQIEYRQFINKGNSKTEL